MLVVGGGIAGLAAAWRLAAQGIGGVRLVEAERIFGFHASSRNAAIWLPHEEDETTAPLARRSEELLNGLLGEGRWRRPRVAWLCTEAPEALGPPRETAGRAGLLVGETLEGRSGPPRALLDEVPVTAGGGIRAAVRLEGGGVIDVHGVLEALQIAARRAGVRLERARRAVALERVAGRVVAVRLDDGGRVVCDAVVVAAGAWAEDVGRLGGVSSRPLTPLRRHLVQLETMGTDAWPMLWYLGPGACYFRPESGGLLASGCDETPWPPSEPPVEASEVESLAERLLHVAPGLEMAAPRRVWACLRTFAPDRELLLGEDPESPGLWWFAGLGGRGMTVGVGAAEWLACAIAEGAPLPRSVRPDRPLEPRFRCGAG